MGPVGVMWAHGVHSAHWRYHAMPIAMPCTTVGAAMFLRVFSLAQTMQPRQRQTQRGPCQALCLHFPAYRSAVLTLVLRALRAKPDTVLALP